MVQRELRVHLFGGLVIQRLNDPDAASITRFPTRKVAALLALLALSPGRRFTRETLIDSLWTDSSLEDGRRSLRVALTILRRILEPPGTVYSDVLVADRETVALRAEAITTDVAEFESAVRRGDIEQARALYNAGPLLPALYDDWVLDVRTRLDETYAALPERASVRVAVAVAELLPEIAPAKQDPNERLPSYLTRFIGREAEVEKLTALWDDPTNRLITVTGTGGMGKTRLVTQACTTTPRSRVLRFAALYDATDIVGLHRAMIALLRLDPAQADEKSIVNALDVLGPARLILDNVEQLVASGIADTVEEWLSACPDLQIVITSRQRLHIPGERELALSPLVAPTLPATPERLLDFDSVRLFVDRAQIARSDVQVTPRNAEMIAALCEQLGGLPLALELTAAWAGVLTFSQMLTRVESHLLDDAGPPTAAKRATRPERHRTLRAALDISFDLLTPELQDAFISLAVFRGSFTADAAQAVLGGSAGNIETLSSLRENSLITVETHGETEALRFRMLPAIYAYTRERFEADSRRAAALSEAHCDYFLHLSEALRTEEKALEVDADNFRVALDIAEARHDDTDLRLCIALAPFWIARGYGRYGIEHIEHALKRRPNSESHIVGAGWHQAGKLAYALDEYERSRTHHEIAFQQAQEAGDPLRIGQSLHCLASLALHADTDIPRAIELVDAARSQFQKAGAVAEEAGLLIGRGVIAHVMSDFEGAVQFLRESLALSERVDNTHWQAVASHYLGNNLLHLGKLDEAITHTETALRMYRESGTVSQMARVLADLGNIAYEQDNHDRAMHHYEDSVALLRAQGERWGVAVGLSNMGRLASEMGEFARAARLLIESLNLRVQLRSKHAILQSLDAVINLLIYMAVPSGKPLHRQKAQEAVRLRAADTALRAELGLPEANEDESLLPKWGALRGDLGETICSQEETEGTRMTLDEAVAATQAILIQIR